MEATIQQIEIKGFMKIIAIAALMAMAVLATLSVCNNITRTVNTTHTGTMQLTSDTSWVKGGWE